MQSQGLSIPAIPGNTDYHPSYHYLGEKGYVDSSYLAPDSDYIARNKWDNSVRALEERV